MAHRRRTVLACLIVAAGLGGASGFCAGRDHGGMLRSGTAFFVSRSGEMLTSAHVVRGCRRIDVWAGDTKRVTATLAAIDERRDLALLVTNHPVEAAARPLDRTVRAVPAGAPVYTIGFGLTPSSPLVPVMTRGSVRGTSRSRGHGLLVLHAALHEGNSGGPVVDAQGVLVGMIVGRYADKPDIGVAVPARDLAQFLDARSTAPPLPAAGSAAMVPDARLRQISALVQCVE